MTCSDWEDRVALYAGGDLDAVEASEVERHLAGCAGCRLLLSGVNESLQTLRGAHAEAVDPAHFAAVRARVLSELESGRRPWWRLAWLPAAVVVAAAILALVWIRPLPRPRASVATVAPAAPPMVVTPPAEVVPEAPKTAPHRHAVARAIEPDRAPAETVLVKLETNDPDVVIYWIAENKGDPK